MISVLFILNKINDEKGDTGLAKIPSQSLIGDQTSMFSNSNSTSHNIYFATLNLKTCY